MKNSLLVCVLCICAASCDTQYLAREIETPFPMAVPNTVTLTDLTPILPAPAEGNEPVSTLTSPEFYGTAAWRENERPHTGPFALVKNYTAVLTLTPNEGYGFVGFQGTVNPFTHGAASFVTQEKKENTLTVTVYFPPIPSADDADFISFSGERVEKYYWQLDPAVWNRLVPVSAATTVSFNPGGAYDTYYGNNRLSIDNFIMRYFIENGNRSLHVKGTVAHRLSIFSGNSPGTRVYEAPFDTTRSYYITTDLHANNLLEEYDILTPYTNSSLVLPQTGAYSNSYHIYKYKTYRYFMSAQELLSLAPSHNQSGSIIFHEPAPTNMEYSVETFDPYVLKSRDFYQYKTFTVTYPDNVILFGVSPESIVQGYTATTNSLFVTLNPYNTPFAGKIISFWIVAPDGTLREKIVSVN